METHLPKRIEFIDFARALAILGIALYHYLMPLNSERWFQLAITFGGTGIHLFFFLSGYGLGLSRPLPALPFYRRRFVKVLGPYYLFVTFVFLLNLLIPIYPGQGWKDYLSHIFLYKMFFEHHMVSFGFHLWFMSTLIQLYLLFPLLRRLVSGDKGEIWVVFFAMLALAYNLLIIKLHHASHRTWNSFFPAYLWEFALGVWLGLRKDERIFQLSGPKALALGLSGLVGMALMTFLIGQAGRLLNDLFAFMAIMGVVVFIYNLTKILTPLKGIYRFLVLSGPYSYEFYLVHYLGFSVLKYLERMGILFYGWWALPLLLFISASMAWFFHRLYQWIGFK
ncbi:MAG: acyltransferase [Bacteroidales bacterium]